MKLDIKELKSSPFIRCNEFDLTLEQLEHCEYSIYGSYFKILYKGFPYLVERISKKQFKILGFIWTGGTGSKSYPYYPPILKVGYYKNSKKVLEFIDRNYKKGKLIPQPNDFSDYNDFSLDDSGLWDELLSLIKVNESNDTILHSFIRTIESILIFFMYE